MKQIFVILSGVLLLTACGRNEDSKRRMAAGPALTADRYAGVGFLDSGDSVCTGTLVAPRLVLTAAHCVHTRELPNLSFTLNPQPLGAAHVPYANGTRVTIHPQYNEKGEDPGVDVALVELSSTSYGYTVERFLALGDERLLKKGMVLHNIGYGENADGSDAIKRAKAVRFRKLAELPLLSGELANGIVEVGRGPAGEIGCSGDSGSPLVFEPDNKTAVIVGIYSTSEDHDHHHVPEKLGCSKGIETGNYVAPSTFRAWLGGLVH